MSTLRGFGSGCVLQDRALFSWATPLGYASSTGMVPVFQIIVLVQLTRDAGGHGDATYPAVGNVMQGTALNGISRVAVGFPVAAALDRVALGRADLRALAVCGVLISATTAGLRLLVGSRSLVYRDMLLIANLVYGLFLILVGVTLAARRLPTALQRLSWGPPMTLGIAAARLAVAGPGWAASADSASASSSSAASTPRWGMAAPGCWREGPDGVGCRRRSERRRLVPADGPRRPGPVPYDAAAGP